MPPLERNPNYVAGFVAALAFAQLGALATQFVRGYRPFMNSPGRVVLSWDMFSTAISRCDVRWDPPLVVDGRSIERLHDAALPLEWDPVYDRVEDYVSTARIGCSRATSETTATLTCFTRHGETLHDAFRCR